MNIKSSLIYRGGWLGKVSKRSLVLRYAPLD